MSGNSVLTENEFIQIRDMMKKILAAGEPGFAYFYPLNGSPRQKYYIALTAGNIANFLGSHFFDAAEMIITDTMDCLVLNTIGGFIDHCPDQELLKEILPVLIPIQQGETKAEDIIMVAEEELEQYYGNEEKAFMNWSSV